MSERNNKDKCDHCGDAVRTAKSEYVDDRITAVTSAVKKLADDSVNIHSALYNIITSVKDTNSRMIDIEDVIDRLDRIERLLEVLAEAVS